MSNNVFIYHHLGLGDHFHCNGIVRYLIRNKYQNKNVKLFAKEKYSKMIKFMYRDIGNLEIISITNNEKYEWNEVNSHLKKNDILKKIGFEYFDKNKDKNKTIDMLFYEENNIDYSRRFELTYWKRDYEREDKLYNLLVKKKDYVFIHDDPSRGFVIKDDYINNKFQIIRNSYDYDIFDYAKILENAKEIHLMESSIRCMNEYINTENSRHYLYNFIDGPWKSLPFYNHHNTIVGSIKDWKIINLNFKKNFFQKLLRI